MELREKEKTRQDFSDWEKVIPDRQSKTEELTLIQIELKRLDQQILRLGREQDETQTKRLDAERLKNQLEVQLKHWQMTLTSIPHSPKLRNPAA